MYLSGIAQKDINDVWPDVAPMIEDALAHGSSDFELQDVYEWLLRGDQQLWIVHDGDSEKIFAVVVTQIQHSSRCKFCNIFICTGESREMWQDQIYIIEDWAKSLGCDRMKMMARKGWQKVLKDYEVKHVELEKKL